MSGEEGNVAPPSSTSTAEEKTEEVKSLSPSASKTSVIDARSSVSKEEQEPINISPSEVADFWKIFADETSNSINNITDFAKSASNGLYIPEIVVVGQQGGGKSLLVEAILGHSIGNLEPTNRPVFITLVNTNGQSNSKDFEEPKIVIKRDVHLQNQFPSDKSVNLKELREEMAKRSSSELVSSPIQIVFQWNYCPNLGIIDAPGLTDWTTQDERSKLVSDLCKDPNRVLMFVEQARDWPEVQCLEMASRLDSTRSRSIFVFNHFWDLIRSFRDSSEINNYLTKKPHEDMKCFFVSLFSATTRTAAMEKGVFQERVVQCYKRDLRFLESIKFDRREEDWIGINNLRFELLRSNYAFFKDALVSIRKKLTNSKQQVSSVVSALEDQKTLDPSKIRWLMSAYVADWIQVIVHFVDGSHEGGTAIYGQTLEEENKAPENQPWTDHHGHPILLEELFSSSLAKDRMSGGEQFNRLLLFFRQMFYMPVVSIVSESEVEEAMANLNDNGNYVELLAISTHIVQRRLKYVFLPLIEQLTARATQNTKRLADIGFNVISTQSKKLESSSRKLYGFTLIKGFPHFQNCIRDVFSTFVESIASEFKQGCSDEMKGSRLLLFKKHQEPNLNGTKFEIVQELATHLLAETKEYILRNVLLKAHRAFVADFQRNVSGEVLKNVSLFSDAFLDEMFDLKGTQVNVKAELDKQEAQLDSLNEKESELKELSMSFARLKVVPNKKTDLIKG